MNNKSRIIVFAIIEALIIFMPFLTLILLLRLTDSEVLPIIGFIGTVIIFMAIYGITESILKTSFYSELKKQEVHADSYISRFISCDELFDEINKRLLNQKLIQSSKYINNNDRTQTYFKWGLDVVLVQRGIFTKDTEKHAYRMFRRTLSAETKRYHNGSNGKKTRLVQIFILEDDSEELQKYINSNAYQGENWFEVSYGFVKSTGMVYVSKAKGLFPQLRHKRLKRKMNQILFQDLVEMK